MGAFKINDVRIAIVEAKRVFAALKDKYPLKGAWLVFSSRLGQCGLGAEPAEMAKEFPQMIRDTPAKTALVSLVSDLKKSE